MVGGRPVPAPPCMHFFPVNQTCASVDALNALRRAAEPRLALLLPRPPPTLLICTPDPPVPLTLPAPPHPTPPHPTPPHPTPPHPTPQYRTSHNFRDPAFLGARLGDKFFTGLLMMSLWFGIGEATRRARGHRPHACRARWAPRAARACN
jgi:hypothetical protein